MKSAISSHETLHLLGNRNRCVRALIGAGALASVLSVPGFDELWLFALSMVGFYGCMTAILGIDLVGGHYQCSSESQDRKEEIIDTATARDRPEIAAQPYDEAA